LIIWPIIYLRLAKGLRILFPFTQVMQDVRALVLPSDSGLTVTADDALNPLEACCP
jgi:hypothetical protein